MNKGIIVIKHAVLDNLTKTDYTKIQKILMKNDNVSFTVNSNKDRI